eukprot:682573-Rhodomonas_salina.1
MAVYATAYNGGAATSTLYELEAPLGACHARAARSPLVPRVARARLVPPRNVPQDQDPGPQKVPLRPKTYRGAVLCSGAVVLQGYESYGASTSTLAPPGEELELAGHGVHAPSPM